MTRISTICVLISALAVLAFSTKVVSAGGPITGGASLGMDVVRVVKVTPNPGGAHNVGGTGKLVNGHELEREQYTFQKLQNSGVKGSKTTKDNWVNP